MTHGYTNVKFTIYICQPVKYAVHVSQELWLPEYRCGLQPNYVGDVNTNCAVGWV